jgi:hypothetical protein
MYAWCVVVCGVLNHSRSISRASANLHLRSALAFLKQIVEDLLVVGEHSYFVAYVVQGNQHGSHCCFARFLCATHALTHSLELRVRKLNGMVCVWTSINALRSHSDAWLTTCSLTSTAHEGAGVCGANVDNVDGAAPIGTCCETRVFTAVLSSAT